VTATTTPITGLFKEPQLLASGLNYAIKFDADDQKSKTGWYLELSNMITGSRWISAGPGYRHWLWDEKASTASAAVSAYLHTMAQTRFEAPDLTKAHIRLGVQAMYQDQTQINYFGIGPNSPDLKSRCPVEEHRHGGIRVHRALDAWTIERRSGLFVQPKVSSPARDVQAECADDARRVPARPRHPVEQPAELPPHAGAITGDTRDYRGHPTRGGVYRISADSYHDQDTGPLFTFRQYQAEALQFVRVTGPNWLLAFHGGSS
jgi:hypothetical protein